MVWRKGNPPIVFVGMLTDATTMENSMEIPQKTKSKATMWPSNPTPEHISEKMIILKDTFIPMFIRALFTVAKTCQQPKWPHIHEWITKMLYIYIMDYHSFLWKNEIMPFAATWMDLEMIILSAANQTEKDCLISGLITSWEIDGETVETVSDFILGGSKITAIKRRLLLGRKVMTNLDSIFKSRDITLLTKVCLVKAMVFPVVMYGCESCTMKKAECWRIDAVELWCWRRLLTVPWTARRSNQSILKEINPGISLGGMMLKLKL